MNCYLYIVESCSELIQWVDGHTCGLLWRLELGMHSGCGLSPCGDEALVVLDITAAVCELLLTVTSCGWVTELFVVVGGTGELGNVNLVLHVPPQSAHHYSSSLL